MLTRVTTVDLFPQNATLEASLSTAFRTAYQQTPTDKAVETAELLVKLLDESLDISRNYTFANAHASLMSALTTESPLLATGNV